MVVTLATAGLMEGVLLPLIALAYGGLYLRRARTLARRGHPVPRARVACFGAGLTVLVLALSPPVDELADELLIAHMAEHLLIADIAALLLVLGLTGPMIAPILRLPVGRHLRWVSHPVVAVALWAIDLYAWHTPFLYQAALRHDLVHGLEHAAFLAFGMNLWLPLFGPLPKPEWFATAARLGYIVVVRLIGTVLANVLLWSETVFYPYYRGEHGISALSDQSTAGGLMMIEESLLTLGLLCWLFLRAAQESEERLELLDLAARRGVALDERRVARAVTAGRGRELRARVLEAETGTATSMGVGTHLREPRDTAG
jgi:cytochrome c oxidase assembly factor CtaG